MLEPGIVEPTWVISQTRNCVAAIVMAATVVDPVKLPAVTVTVAKAAARAPVDRVPIRKATSSDAPVGAVSTSTDRSRMIWVTWTGMRAKSALSVVVRVPGDVKTNFCASVTTLEAPIKVEEALMLE